MHEIPNFPFPSLHEPEQTPAAQSTREHSAADDNCETPETRHADRKDQAR